MIFSVPLREKEKKNIMKKTENPPISKSANSNFGPWGWFIILFALLSFMFAGNLIVDGLNITVAAFTELRGWESGVLLSCSTVAGLVAIVGCVILSNCVCRFGVKAVYCVSLAVVCCCCMVWGSVTQLWQYILILILVNVFGNGFGFVGGTAILANWFPQKKGLAMGWATIGFQASAVALLPAFQWLLERYNLKVAYRLMGLCLLALLMVCLFLVKGDPEDRGCAPDNDWSHSLEEYQQLHRAALKQEKTHRWTTLRLLKTKQMWQIGLVNGLVQMAITVLIVQFIPNLINCGFSANAATLIYSVASVIGAIGSYLWGVLDQKIGVKKATVWMCVFHGVAGALFALASSGLFATPVLPILGAFVVGSILGVSSNYVGSFTATVFGRYGYAKAFGMVYMIVCGLRSIGYVLIGALSAVTGSYTLSYVLAGVLSIVALGMTLFIDERCIECNE